MSTADLRSSTIEWKKNTLAKLRQGRTLIRELDSSLNKLYGSVKTLMNDARRDAKQLAAQYDKYINAMDEEDTYHGLDPDDLRHLPDADVGDGAKFQASESLEELISYLDEFVAAVKAVEP